MVMRRLNVGGKRPVSLETVRELDAFPKVPDGFQETTPMGGFVTLLVILFTGTLMYYEIVYYTGTDLVFSYDVDKDMTAKLNINVDIIVAMKCGSIGADVLDLTGANQATFGKLEETPMHFALTPKQAEYVQMSSMVNTYLRSEYHALHTMLWQTGYGGWALSLPPREIETTEPFDACRLNGTLTVNKVAGNFHITAGRALDFGGGHMHLAMDPRFAGHNFTHRILHLSFGENIPGIISPLDGEVKITSEGNHIFQYFIQVVPTRVKMSRRPETVTYQYAVTEENRTLDHSKGSHGMPGIFVRYDLSSLRILVEEHRKSYWRFLVRLCGIVGGVYATSGILHGICQFLFEVVCCQYSLGKFGKQKSQSSSATTPPSEYNASNSLLATDNAANNRQNLLFDSSVLSSSNNAGNLRQS